MVGGQWIYNYREAQVIYSLTTDRQSLRKFSYCFLFFVPLFFKQKDFSRFVTFFFFFFCEVDSVSCFVDT